jgi:hypothetical protein
MGKAYSTHGGDKNTLKILGLKPEGQDHLGYLDKGGKIILSNNNPVLQQPTTGPGLPHCEVSRSCRRTTWV